MRLLLCWSMPGVDSLNVSIVLDDAGGASRDMGIDRGHEQVLF